MNKSTKKRIGALGVACALCLTMAASFAYFTDRVEVKASVTGGTVGITHDAGVDQAHDWIKQLQAGPQDLDNINPGDSRSLAFTVTNTGNKAIDVRHTIKLSVVDAAGKPKAMEESADWSALEMLQFDIYRASDVETMSGTDEATYNAGYVLKPTATPLFKSDSVNADGMGARRTVDAANGTVTYYFADTTLDGVGADATKVETGYSDTMQVATTLVDGSDVKLNADGTAVTYDYVLIFRDTTLNDFQGCTLTAEMVIEAKQHLNTNSSWKNIETVDYTMTVGQPAAQQTGIETAPNNQTGVLDDVNNNTSGTYNTNVPH